MVVFISPASLTDKLSVFATKEELFATKGELTKEIASVRNEMHDMEVRLNRNSYIVGVVQFLAIVGSLLILLKFHVILYAG